MVPIEALQQFICSDDAYFYLNLPVNKQNNRIWATEAPHVAVERPLQDQKVLVWCAMSSTKIHGPRFLYRDSTVSFKKT